MDGFKPQFGSDGPREISVGEKSVKHAHQIANGLWLFLNWHMTPKTIDALAVIIASFLAWWRTQKRKFRIK